MAGVAVGTEPAGTVEAGTVAAAVGVAAAAEVEAAGRTAADGDRVGRAGDGRTWRRVPCQARPYEIAKSVCFVS
ncbi:hypothetical protein GCM10009780_49130 [Actinomadura alba]